MTHPTKDCYITLYGRIGTVLAKHKSVYHPSIHCIIVRRHMVRFPNYLVSQRIIFLPFFFPCSSFSPPLLTHAQTHTTSFIHSPRCSYVPKLNSAKINVPSRCIQCSHPSPSQHSSTKPTQTKLYTYTHVTFHHPTRKRRRRGGIPRGCL